MDNLQTLNHYTKFELLRISSVFPFDFFPDTLVVTPEEVNIISKPFFYTEEVYPILIKDVRAVVLNKNLLFAQLTFDIQGIQVLQRQINFLWKEDAELARRLITGSMIVQKEKVDISKYSEVDLKNYLLSIGSVGG
jgi:hypothetical protein